MHQIKWHGIDFIEREQNERRKKRLLRRHQAICCKLFMISQRYFCRGGIFYIIFVAETIDFRFRISNAISNWQSHEPQIQTKQSAQNDMEDTKGVRRLGSFSLKKQQFWSKKHIFSLHQVHCFRRYVYEIYVVFWWRWLSFVRIFHQFEMDKAEDVYGIQYKISYWLRCSCLQEARW